MSQKISEGRYSHSPSEPAIFILFSQLMKLPKVFCAAKKWNIIFEMLFSQLNSKLHRFKKNLWYFHPNSLLKLWNCSGLLKYLSSKWPHIFRYIGLHVSTKALMLPALSPSASASSEPFSVLISVDREPLARYNRLLYWRPWRILKPISLQMRKKLSSTLRTNSVWISLTLFLS